ncbi:sigma-70 family RNA polymerase sigma factor [Acetobacter lambici]|uniref:Sigma-70 family RNA polymerase sigma factor n=1 Tax=Acetobacter lambici TaxID=1332824 RepID=A0ABT1F0X6_9PROT|nr:sigma-70 family RNA polymerase sigma factor [Acetobacter lambici]MCP1242676.1 sigma-70 family RNA polymerase sigma factor [Acetobacter lambici]MCP1258835.1 sigma-70 family RNA polymerase sigma factor [Acetobacter lambici]NHO57144.1 sigma-70 family RNA polymerase sigma factor [Acetobacter lambici]
MLALLPSLRGFARFLARDPTMADDLVQETVLRALDRMAQYEAGSSLKAWCFTILRNLFLEQRRRGKKEREVLAHYEQQPPLRAASAADGRQEVHELEVLLWQLSPLLREALVLIGAQGMTYVEAAEICEVDVGTIKARVSRARTMLHKLAQQQAGEGG